MIKLKIQCPECGQEQPLETNHLHSAWKRCIECHNMIRANHNVIGSY